MYYNQRFETNHHTCCNKEVGQKYDYTQDCDQKFDYDYDKNSCCVKRVEETFFCCPSYYNEEKEDCKKDDEQKYWEGTFKFWESPKHQKNQNKCNEEPDRRYNTCCKSHNKCCGLCGLFRRW